ncbi:ribosomal L32p family protein [Xylona heveae TC161]|uniref:Large ribosomal subunit protein bL32m n=1 Tax=Xylona heveae (strain CBS 132557 / TC161) TaxID=1328760 RepID=A0A165J4I2_XYLHT|nr:ribosomal L32p family protein [Xylona heveae TC161]KZF25720.1 ribosomal L32p family protein [Xylona heveae TC161]
MALSISSAVRSSLPAVAPLISSEATAFASRSAMLQTRRFALPLLPSISFAIPVAIHLNIPSIIPGLWESILKAVPKKKTSHMKKRHRQMAGKGLKDVTSLNRCSSCGNVKRAHILCPHCVKGKKLYWQCKL